MTPQVARALLFAARVSLACSVSEGLMERGRAAAVVAANAMQEAGYNANEIATGAGLLNSTFAAQDPLDHAEAIERGMGDTNLMRAGITFRDEGLLREAIASIRASVAKAEG